jgi:hypothetical protein
MPLAPRAVWLGAVAAVGIATAAALLVILIGDPGEDDLRTVGTLIAALFAGGAALGALELLERPGYSWVGAVVLVAAAVAFVLATLGLWKAGYEGEGLDDWFKLFPIGIAWASALVVFATTTLLAGAPRRYTAPAVGIAAAAWAAVATGLVWTEADSDGWAKLLGALAVLTVGGFLAAPLWRRAQATP